MTLRYNSTELDIATRTVVGEARGASFDAKKHIAWVIRNRVEADLGHDGKPDWWGEGIVGVCLKKGQFSCWNENDPNSKIIRAMKMSNASYINCEKAVMEVFGADTPDPTHGSVHYCTIQLHPKWADGHLPVLKDDVHKFYNDVK